MKRKYVYVADTGSVRVPCVPESTWGPVWLADNAAVPEAARDVCHEAEPSHKSVIEPSDALPDLHGVLLGAINEELAAEGLAPVPPDAFELVESEIDWWAQLSVEQTTELTASLPRYAPCTFCGGRTVHNPNCYTLHNWPVMPFGKHRGMHINEVPADYLQWCLGKGAIRDAGLFDAIASYLGI